MFTSEKLLKTLSVAIVSITILFILFVVAKEAVKPALPLEKIKQSQCSDFAIADETVKNETNLQELSKDCLFIPSELSQKSEFFKSLFKFGQLENFDYLFSGESGILIKKSRGDFTEQAKFLLNRFRKNGGDAGLKDEKFTLTAVAMNLDGKAELSVTYDETSLFQIAKNLPELFAETAKFKKLDLQKLRLSFYFHSKYAYLEEKNADSLILLTKKGVDGLYLKSRGAKIRLLPWEYSANPISVLDRKGRQYGLDKDEYKKAEASLYLYRTKQYVENMGDVLLLQAGSSPEKGDYSYLFSSRLIAKHLKNIQTEEGDFPAKSNLMRLNAVKSLLNFSKIAQDSQFVDIAGKTLNYVLSNSDAKRVSDAFFLNLLFSFPELEKQNVLKRKGELSEKFTDFNEVKGAISEDPLYAGIFLQTFNLLFHGKDREEKLQKLLNLALDEFAKMGIKERLVFIAYLSEFKVDEDSQLFVIIKNFFVSHSPFLKKQLFDHRNFVYEMGTFKSSEGVFPDYSLSLLLAEGLSQAVLNGYHNFEILKIVSQMKHFVNYLIVTSDDFPNWTTPKDKTKIQGALRAVPMGKKIKFSNTIRAFNYFINETIYENSQ